MVPETVLSSKYTFSKKREIFFLKWHCYVRFDRRHLSLRETGFGDVVLICLQNETRFEFLIKF